MSRLRILVTAGPTREVLDPVRYLTNRSSGKMGYAVAHAAAKRGHEVILVSGPTALEVPVGVEFVSVESAEDLYRAVERRSGRVDVMVMAAAVADYRPAEVAEQKIKKVGETMTLELVKTRDVLGSSRGEMGFAGLLVGFAAETENVAGNALAKLEGKGCDLMVANDVSKRGVGFDAAENELVVFFRVGRVVEWGRHGKGHLGEMLVEICEREFGGDAGTGGRGDAGS